MIKLRAEMNYNHYKPRECKINGETPQIFIDSYQKEIAKVKKGDVLEVTKERANELLNRTDGLKIASIIAIEKEVEVETADKKIENVETTVVKPKRTTKTTRKK